MRNDSTAHFRYSPHRARRSGSPSRSAASSIDYLAAFVALARESTWSAPRMLR